LGLFLAIGILSLQACGSIIKGTRGIADLGWMNELARMMQVSLIGYAVSGAFLGLAYFNYYYALIAIVVGMQVVLAKELAEVGVLTSEDRRFSPRPLRPQPAAATRALAGAASAGGGARFERPLKAAGGPSPLKGLPTAKEAIALAKEWYRRL
jgi:hypothetical protein